MNRSGTLRVGDLELDRLTQQVKRGGKRVKLTAKEYALLASLIQNAERMLSRNMIIEHVWDHSFDVMTNIVDVYVRHLRSKVDDGNIFACTVTAFYVGMLALALIFFSMGRASAVSIASADRR